MSSHHCRITNKSTLAKLKSEPKHLSLEEHYHYVIIDLLTKYPLHYPSLDRFKVPT